MVKTDRYPEPRRAVPVNFLRPSRTSKFLTPGIVLVTLVIIIVASIVGTIVAASIFDSKSPHRPGESAAQVFVLIAASISMLYSIFHSFAVYENEPVGIVRPPEQRVHAYCFIAARLGLVAWTIALIASSVVASKPTVCLRWDRDCKLQILDVVCAGLAFVATGILLTALEACYDPFATPKILHIPQMITCRVSSFGDEVFDRSRRTSLDGDESVAEEIRYLCAMEQNDIPRKPLPRHYTIPGEFPREHKMLSSVPPISKAKGWGEEWTHLVRDTSMNDITRTNSSTSISQFSSTTTSASNGSSNTSVSNRVSRLYDVTPSSSIGNLSKRSKLSTMRSIEFPNVPVPTQLRYLPPVIAPPHEWNTFNTASLTQLLPLAKPYSSWRQSSGTPAPLRIMKPISAAPPVFAPSFRRTTLDVKIPGAFIDYNPCLEFNVKSEEQEPVFGIQVAPKRKDPVRLPGGEFEMHYAPNFLDSRTRYGQHKRVQPSSTYSGTDSAVFMEAVKVHYVKPSKTVTPIKSRTHRRRRMRQFKRLSLGDLSPGLGKLWED